MSGKCRGIILYTTKKSLPEKKKALIWKYKRKLEKNQYNLVWIYQNHTHSNYLAHNKNLTINSLTPEQKLLALKTQWYSV